MKFNLHGYSSPDWKRPPSPPWKRQNNISTPRTHIYIECEAPLQHHKNTDNDNDNNNTYYNFWDVQGGGGRSSHKYQSLWSFTQKIMEYQWVCCHLSSPLPLPHPPDSCSSIPAFSDREDVQNSEQEEPLPLLHHWNLLPIRVSSLEDSGPVSSPSSLENSAPVDSSA